MPRDQGRERFFVAAGGEPLQELPIGQIAATGRRQDAS